MPNETIIPEIQASSPDTTLIDTDSISAVPQPDLEPPTPTAPAQPRTRRRKAVPAPDPTIVPADDEAPVVADADQPRSPAIQSSPAADTLVLRKKSKEDPVLTLIARNRPESEKEREDTAWHDIRSAYISRRILTGQLCGIEPTGDNNLLAVINYEDMRVAIPLQEMLLDLPNSAGQSQSFMQLRRRKLLANMLGADIDFIVKGMDSKSHSIVASRREAMLRKQRIYYLTPNANGDYQVREGRIVEARVVALAEKTVRVEVFGVECSIQAKDLAWEWVGDAHERFAVGDEILVRILEVNRDDPDHIRIRVDVKSVHSDSSRANLKQLHVQCKYAGRVTDIHKGIYYLRLMNGVNAVAHSCYDYRSPGRKDDVSFVVTKVDEERGIAIGIITRIIRQNL